MHGVNVGETGTMEQVTRDNISYLAGLFDGEGTVTCKKYWSKKPKGTYNCWRISMEIAMTDKPTVKWCCDHFGGNLREKPRKGGHKMQYRWRRGFRDAYRIARMIYPFAVTKRSDLEKIIKRYEKMDV